GARGEVSGPELAADRERERSAEELVHREPLEPGLDHADALGGVAGPEPERRAQRVILAVRLHPVPGDLDLEVDPAPEADGADALDRERRHALADLDHVALAVHLGREVAEPLDPG